MLHIIVGGVVVVMALIAGFGGVRLGSYHQRTPQEREASAKRTGNKLFIPATRSGGDGDRRAVVQQRAGVANRGVRQRQPCDVDHPVLDDRRLPDWHGDRGENDPREALQPVQEARRLLDSIGWAFILPQILATLGLLFTVAGVGTAISHLTQGIWRSITALSPWQSTLSVWRC